MHVSIKKVLLALLICSLPSLGSAADIAPAAETLKTPAPVVTAPKAEAPAVLKSSDTPKATPSARIGYADIDKIQSESDLGKASLAQVKEKQEKLQGQIQTKEKQLSKQQDAIKAKIASMSAAQREAKAKEFQKKVDEYQKFVQNADKELQSLKIELAKKFGDALELAAQEYGKSKGLTLVVVKRELLYLANEVDTQDVSEGIIQIMNEKNRKK